MIRNIQTQLQEEAFLRCFLTQGVSETDGAVLSGEIKAVFFRLQECHWQQIHKQVLCKQREEGSNRGWKQDATSKQKTGPYHWINMKDVYR